MVWGFVRGWPRLGGMHLVCIHGRWRGTEVFLLWGEAALMFPFSRRRRLGGGCMASFKDVLLGRQRETDGGARAGCSETHPIVISSETFEVDRLRHSCVIEWASGCCDEIHASSFVADLGAEAKVVKMGRSRSLLVFNSEEGLRRALIGTR
ncbi:hypothetical protein Dimus_010284 [Dionaea muscipula]